MISWKQKLEHDNNILEPKIGTCAEGWLTRWAPMPTFSRGLWSQILGFTCLNCFFFLLVDRPSRDGSCSRNRISQEAQASPSIWNKSLYSEKATNKASTKITSKLLDLSCPASGFYFNLIMGWYPLFLSANNRRIYNPSRNASSCTCDSSRKATE